MLHLFNVTAITSATFIIKMLLYRSETLYWSKSLFQTVSTTMLFKQLFFWPIANFNKTSLMIATNSYMKMYLLFEYFIFEFVFNFYYLIFIVEKCRWISNYIYNGNIWNWTLIWYLSGLKTASSLVHSVSIKYESIRIKVKKKTSNYKLFHSKDTVR